MGGNNQSFEAFTANGASEAVQCMLNFSRACEMILPYASLACDVNRRLSFGEPCCRVALQNPWVLVAMPKKIKVLSRF